MQAQGIPADMYPPISHLIRPILEKFTGDGAHTVEDFEAMIADRSAQCWIGGEGGKIKVVCLTQIVPDRLRTCQISFCGGEDFRDWISLIETIAAFAKSEGCARFRVLSRPGYAKFLAQHGLIKTHDVLDRSL